MRTIPRNTAGSACSRHASPARGALAALALVVLASACALFHEPVPHKLPLYARVAQAGELEAGAAAIDITPARDLYLGGFEPLRRSTGVHDPLFARALVLRRGDVELALVSCDLVGLMRPQTQEIRAALEGLDARHVIVASTHDHHSPDTMGLWGVPALSSGADPEYMAQVRAGAVRAITAARAALRPAEIGAASATFDPKGFIKNSRRPGLIDPDVAVLHVRERGGARTIATLIELGCHPEAVKRANTLVTADFPGWAVRALEAELGGVGIYVSGALGALVSPDRSRAAPDDTLAFGESRRIGEALADHARRALRTIGTYDAAPALGVWHSLVYLPNDNWRYDLLRWTGVVERKVFGSGYLETEVSLWRIGTFALAAVPGEISPDLGLRIARAAGGAPTMLVGLANDELGYLVPPWDYSMSYYDYERTLCVGREAGWRVVMRLEDLALYSEAALGAGEPAAPQ